MRILRLKLEHFKSDSWTKRRPEVTAARLQALRELLERDLQPFMRLVLAAGEWLKRKGFCYIVFEAFGQNTSRNEGTEDR